MKYVKNTPFSGGNMKLQTSISSKNRFNTYAEDWKYFTRTEEISEEIVLSESFAEEVKYSKRA